jgi:hypothetical protein
LAIIAVHLEGEREIRCAVSIVAERDATRGGEAADEERAADDEDE